MRLLTILFTTLLLTGCGMVDIIRASNNQPETLIEIGSLKRSSRQFIQSKPKLPDLSHFTLTPQAAAMKLPPEFAYNKFGILVFSDDQNYYFYKSHPTLGLTDTYIKAHAFTIDGRSGEIIH